MGKIKKFNVFRKLGLNEKQHSNLLKKLLQPNGSHNQGSLFLKEFLNIIDLDPTILDEEKIKIDVKTEKKAGKKRRVDLYIRIGKYKIFLENKIDGAKDKKNQLYRYWKSLIFNDTDFRNYCLKQNLEPSNDLSLHKAFYLKADEGRRYRLISLSKSTNKNTNSIKKISDTALKPDNPRYKKLLILPESLPLEVIELSYKDDITRWLKNCLPQIKPNSNFDDKECETLKELIRQYIEVIK